MYCLNCFKFALSERMFGQKTNLFVQVNIDKTKQNAFKQKNERKRGKC